MDIESAAQLLSVKLPTTINVLKQAFKRASLKYHPDHNRAQNANEQFAKVKEAFELLKTSDQLEFTENASRELYTDDGSKLSTLGKGLGPTTNGAPCPECEARGFHMFTNAWRCCEDCRLVADGIFSEHWEYRCHKCKGSGKFKKGDRVIGDCFPCKGKGWYEQRHGYVGNRCQTCRGRQVFNDPNGKKTYTRCVKCKGTGELPMWNPVLPKGLLGNFGGK